MTWFWAFGVRIFDRIGVQISDRVYPGILCVLSSLCSCLFILPFVVLWRIIASFRALALSVWFTVHNSIACGCPSFLALLLPRNFASVQSSRKPEKDKVERIVDKFGCGRILVERHKVITPDGFALTLHRLVFNELSECEENRGVLANTHANPDYESDDDDSSIGLGGDEGETRDASLGSQSQEVLSTNRIDSDPKRTVFCQHGLLESAFNWVALERQSLGYRLVCEGYDVWLGNNRGTEFSRYVGTQCRSFNTASDQPQEYVDLTNPKPTSLRPYKRSRRDSKTFLTWPSYGTWENFPTSCWPVGAWPFCPAWWSDVLDTFENCVPFAVSLRSRISFLISCCFYAMRKGVRGGKLIHPRASVHGEKKPAPIDSALDWTFADMAEFDITSMIAYIENYRRKKNSSSPGFGKIICIGQSQGAAQLLVALSTIPQLREQVERAVLFSPPVVLHRPEESYTVAVKGLIYLGYRCPAEVIATIKFVQSLLPDSILAPLGDRVAGYYMKFYTCFISPQHRLNIFRSTPSGGTSQKNLKHWLQILTHGSVIGEFDETHCASHRGSSQYTSRPYPLREITCPLAFFFGSEDNIVNIEKSVEILQESFAADQCYIDVRGGWGHVDFGWGSNRYRDFYPGLISLLKS